MKVLLFLFLAFIVIAPINTLAGDLASLNFIGFSRDGKYAAFEEYGEFDGEATDLQTYSHYYFLNVEKNSYASNPVRIDSGRRDARTRAKAQARPILKKLRIVANNTGDLLVARMPTDDVYLQVSGNNESIKVKFDTSVNLGMGSPESHEFELVLKTLETKETSPCGNNMYRIELLLKDLKSGTEKYLQKDSNVPEERQCPFYYGIQYVYLNNDSLVVFLNTYVQGFESRDMRYMAVTGKVAMN